MALQRHLRSAAKRIKQQFREDFQYAVHKSKGYWMIPNGTDKRVWVEYPKPGRPRK